jgi:hypothetical protein
MSLSEKDLELIENYLLGDLSAAENEKVEKRMEEDKEFAEEVEFMRNTMQASRLEGRKELRNKLNETEHKHAADIEARARKEMNQEPGGEKIVQLRRRRWLYAAATVAAAAIGFYFGIILPSNQGPKMYNEYFKPYPNKVIPSTRGEEVPEQFAHYSQEEYNLVVRGMKYYERKNYKKAAELFEKHVPQKEENAALVLYKGISQLEAEKEEKALQSFRYILNLGESDIQDQSQWYLALAFLKTNKTESAFEILQIISEKQNHPYKKKADDIIDNLKNRKK